MNNNELNRTTGFRIRVSGGVWRLRTITLFLVLSAGLIQSAAGADTGDAKWRYTLKQPTGWLDESYSDVKLNDDLKWQEGHGGFGTTDDATGRVFTEWTSSEIWLRQVKTLASIPPDAALYVQAPGETEIYINGVLAAKIDSALEKHAVIRLSPESITALRKGKNIVAVHAKAENVAQPHCIDVHLVSANSIPTLVPFTTWDRLKIEYPKWLTIFVTLLVLVALAYEKPADMVFAGAIVFLSLCGVITAQEAFGGFVSQSLLMVAALFLVTAGLKETGIVDMIGARVLGPARTELAGLIMLSLFCVGTSAFLNNTPIVAMLIPVVMSWCRRQHVAPSKMLIPLSFMTILGGCCSRIGTSTNLVVDGLMTKYGMAEMGFFEIASAGVPCAIIGLIYMLTIGRKLLPERKELLEQLGDSRREYLVEMLVTPACRLIGQSIEAAGLRRLPGLFLIEVDRRGSIIAPVSPDTVLEANDRLVFTGIVETIVDLKKIPGLEPATESTDQSAQEERRRRLCEVVVSRSSPLVGQTVREAQFRSHYNAAIVAIHRNGARLTTKIGDVKLESGDTLLMQTGPNFVQAHRNNADFYLVSDVEGSQPMSHERWAVALLIFAVLLAVMSFGSGELAMLGAFIAGGLMIVTRCMSASDGRQAIDWQVLIAIGASFGLGAALEKSGAAMYLSTKLVALTQPYGPYATLAAIYFVTMVLNELITNNGAAVLAFPFCVKAAALSNCDARPFVMAVALAASFAFASPVGYQTHMMVFGPGGYRFNDFVKVGVPLNLLLWVSCVILIPIIWPF
ncbi:MAG: SLC13 family permease [Planctomycetota bacterium]|nr:MAG: SLC13 family permease [Planctomycetota bacterium]